MKKRLLLILLVLTIATPLGLISESPAWGEWDIEYYQQVLGFIPKGIEQAKGVNAPIPDYEVSILGSVGSYYLSAVLGVILIAAFYFVLLKVIKK